MFIMMWFKIIFFCAIEIFSLLSVHTVPYNSDRRAGKVFKRDVENIVSSSVVKLLSPARKSKRDTALNLDTYSNPAKFRWSSNDSFMEDLESMFASVERELDELMNTTRTKISDGFGFNDEFFSFSFSDSESGSASKSEEQTAPPEAAAET